MLITFILSVGQVASVLELPNLMSNIVDIGIVQKGIKDPALVSTGTDATQMRYILSTGAIMLLVTLTSVLLSLSAGNLASRISAGLARDLRAKIFERVESFSLSDINNFSIASLIIRSTNDIAQVQQISFMMMRIAIIAPLQAVGAFVMTLRTNVELSWILGVALPLLGVVIGVTAALATPLFRRQQEKTDRLNLVAREGLSGVRVIRAFNRSATQKERFAVANQDLTKTATKVNSIMVFLIPLMGLVVQVVLVLIIWFGAKLLGPGPDALQIGSLMAYLQYAMNVMFSLMMLSMFLIMLPRASVSAERIAEVLNTQPSITDGKTKLDRPIHSLTFKNTTFCFPGAEEPSLQNIDFRAEKGSTTAIIGSTGSGKSTLVNLILRLYDPVLGDVLVNGTPLRKFEVESVRARIGYTPQKALLFSGSVADNLRVGKQDASEEEMWEALRIAQAESFIKDTPGQLEAEVAQGGTNFSGGQRQRLAIARAIISKPEVLLLDDTFSALDATTEANLRRDLAPLLKDAISVIISQKISSITSADQIIVLDQGEVVGLGTHDELIKTNSVYQEIARSQMFEMERA